jgi:hypothetical protein
LREIKARTSGSSADITDELHESRRNVRIERRLTLLDMFTEF